MSTYRDARARWRKALGDHSHAFHHDAPAEMVAERQAALDAAQADMDAAWDAEQVEPLSPDERAELPERIARAQQVVEHRRVVDVAARRGDSPEAFAAYEREFMRPRKSREELELEQTAEADRPALLMASYYPELRGLPLADRVAAGRERLARAVPAPRAGGEP